ncbi:MAG: hypothetical protein OEZ68_05860 [Gammaproteobacteria bacterium]|nr:hypothetical protein [Gammaproteobacteria bacterium]MDH5800313.1 hypothetical protein [Gammaproteobacteria bacterium]
MQKTKWAFILWVLVVLTGCASGGGVQNACDAIAEGSEFAEASGESAQAMCSAVKSCQYIAPLRCICPADGECICAGSDARCAQM